MSLQLILRKSLSLRGSDWKVVEGLWQAPGRAILRRVELTLARIEIVAARAVSGPGKAILRDEW